MSDSRSRRARELFDQSLELLPEERDAFLREACGSDHELENEVRSLVEALQVTEGFLASGQIGKALSHISSGNDDPMTGAEIGDYKVLGLLARGGMGAVYLAEQEHPRRMVALKLIDRAIATPQLVRRFEVEAQVLARLKHPGIAQIHVAGTTGAEHGERPYFAMELVDGLTLTSFADEGDLDTRARLGLLIKVCEAVQHAHQVGVIHRDLKPANILVTAEGQPKILDFGIARSTDTDLQVTTMAGSQASLLGTLPYMSPEQVRGNPDELDTRSDVHALGVLCFELLTGQMPRNLKGKTLTDAIRTIVDEEPRSLAAAGKGRFPADLETIVAKALESDRHSRYDSASAFAADLQRFLDGQPVSARPQSAVYQLRKLIVRNRLPALLVAGLVLVAVSSAVIMGFQTQRTARERDRANMEAGTATEVSTFLESLFLEADPEQALGEKLTARDILDRGTERIQTELQDQPAVRGRLLAMLGKIYDSLGQTDRAAPLLQEAVDIGRALRKENENVAGTSNQVLALTLLARWHTGHKRNDEAIVLCREALELAEAVHGTESKQYADSLNHLSYQLSLVGSYDEARELNQLGLEIRKRVLGLEHTDVGWSLYQYGWMLSTSGDKVGAREPFQRACDIFEKALPENHPQIARCLADYAQLLIDLEDFDSALNQLERALAIQEETLGREHPTIANTLNDIGFVHWRKGNMRESVRYYSESVGAHKSALGLSDLGTLDRLYNLARMHGLNKDPDTAEAVLLEALNLARTHHSDSPEVVERALGQLGFFFGRRGLHSEAIPYLRKAVQVSRELGESHLADRLTLLEGLAYSLFMEDDVDEHYAVTEEILATRLKHPELAGPRLLFTKWEVGLALVRLERFEEAESRLRQLLSEADRAFDVNAFFPWNIRWVIGHCRYRLGYPGEARALYEEVLNADPQNLGEDLAWLQLRRAEDHAAQGRMEEARGELSECIQAGHDLLSIRMAILINPRLTPKVRQELLSIIEQQ